MLRNCNRLLNNKLIKCLETTKDRKLSVLGIETSCDDTGIAIVRHENGGGTVLANVLSSQQSFHIRYGGIIPPRAQDLHRSHILNVFERCLKESNVQPEDIEAIAVTTRPGLPLSLLVGLRFARYLARLYRKPLIPIHHMKAHALQARMEYDIPYPYLCLLISGGHSQLCFVRSPDDFLLLGESLDDAPGEAFDKIARRLKLYINPKYSKWNGGQIIEDAAKSSTNPEAFEFPLPLARMRDCNFSFAGLKNNSFRAIRRQEQKEGCPTDSVITNYADFCAGLLNAISRHLMHRTQRALEFCIESNFFGSGPRSLVVSGGVANNDAIYGDISYLAEQFGCTAYRPSKKYCSDNGVMIAWNGIERLLSDKNCLRWDYDAIDIKGKADLGKSLIADVVAANIKCKWIRLPKS